MPKLRSNKLFWICGHEAFVDLKSRRGFHPLARASCGVASNSTLDAATGGETRGEPARGGPCSVLGAGAPFFDHGPVRRRDVREVLDLPQREALLHEVVGFGLFVPHAARVAF